jgi:hypothetical protein
MGEERPSFPAATDGESKIKPPSSTSEDIGPSEVGGVGPPDRTVGYWPE